MSDRAKALKIIAIIATSLTLLTLVFLLVLSTLDEFTIYPYICLLISVLPCISLWKSYLDEKKLNKKINSK
ncbi:hypothetical protein R0131_14775 [Clostridium sp. AL.422]|uniref:hypothetical protein n=1 Tax=Clostridium TaxID=1485 RepID=UPI00293DDF12|nr:MULTISPECIES: hypothetical protein [unclassified Clostridium]MDV4152091.1 hypothetical protein [Clostridium sp. AL.422]